MSRYDGIIDILVGSNHDPVHRRFATKCFLAGSCHGDRVMLDALNKIAAMRHHDRTCSLEAQGYDAVECASIIERDSISEIAIDALKHLNEPSS